MDRTRKPSALTFISGSLLSGLVGWVAILSASASAGCTTLETTPAPDGALPPCKAGPFLSQECQPVESDRPSCFTDDGSSPILAKARRATRYPVGCIINFVGPRDEQGDCRLEYVCKCIIGDLRTTQPEAGAPVDAGGDAGSGAAPRPPAPGTSPTAGPIWFCG